MATDLYGDKKAHRIGDILRVEIVEQTSSSKDAQKTTDKQNNITGSISINSPTVDGENRASWGNVSVPSWKLNTTRAFTGKGAMENSDKLTGTISVRVMEVLPNGNLLVEGSRSVFVQNEEAKIILTGMVRPEDISRDNAVKSTAVADATIRYVSSGSIARNQRKGLLTSLWDWVNIF
jgi:flagellar L-ring protein precursor FlgH